MTIFEEQTNLRISNVGNVRSGDDLWFGTEDLVKVAQVLHPTDSVIGFIRKSSGQGRAVDNIAAVEQRELSQLAPHLTKFLILDAYMTVNGYRAKAPYDSPITDLPGVWRKEKNLRYLNAVYADLDVGRYDQPFPQGMSVSQASQELMDLVFDGTLPQFSMSARSGRGLYLFWFLRDEKGKPLEFRSQAQWEQTLNFYKAVNKAIFSRLQCLAADCLSDGARVLRVPGTAHSESGGTCVYKACFNGGAGGPLFTYTLPEIAEHFEVAPSRKTAFLCSSSKGTHPLCANGPKALGEARAAELVWLDKAQPMPRSASSIVTLR